MILWTRFILVNSKYELICFSECKSMQDSLERVRVRCFGTIFYKTTNEILDHFSVISMIPTVSHLPSLRYLVHGVKLQIQNVAPTDRSCWRFTKIVFFSSYFFSINLNVSTYHTYNSMKLNASTAEKTAQQNSEYQTIRI